VVNAGSFIFKLTRAPICDKPTKGFQRHLYDYNCYKIKSPFKLVILSKDNSLLMLCDRQPGIETLKHHNNQNFAQRFF